MAHNALLHMYIDDPKYGGGQFIGKLYTEALGRVPDPEGYLYYQTMVENKGCSPETLCEMAKEVFNSEEYASLGLSPREQAVTLYRAILNRDPMFQEVTSYEDALKASSISDFIDQLIGSDEFKKLIPDIIRGPYFFGKTDCGYALSGKIYTADELIGMLDKADHEVALEPGDLVLAYKPIVIPAGKKLCTRDGYGSHYLRMARIIRTAVYNKAVVTMSDRSELSGIWVDGNRPAFDDRCNVMRVRRGVCVGVEGNGSKICGNRLTDSLGGTSLEVYTAEDTTIRHNLITCYASDHMYKWCDGITIHGTNTITEYNGVVDATDVSVVIFRYRGPKPQNSVCRYNTLINLGNSAFGGINADGWVDAGHDWDFTGCEFTQNAFWTSYKAHQHICLSFATFAWMCDRGDFVVNCRMIGNYTPKGLFVLCGAGIAVDGMKNCEVKHNRIDVYLGPWTNPEIGLTEPQAVCMNTATSTGTVQQPFNDVPMFVGRSGFIHGPWHEPFADAVLRRVSIEG